MKKVAKIGCMALFALLLMPALAASVIMFPDDPAREPPSYTCHEGKALDAVPCSDSVDMDAATSGRVANLIYRSNYTKVEELYNRYNNENNRFADGRWRITKFEEGLESAIAGTETPEKMLDELRAWQEVRKGAVLPRLAEAYYYFTSAWRAVSSSPDGTPSQNARDLYANYMRSAWRILSELDSSGREHVLWHNLRIRVAVAGGAEKSTVRAFFDESRRKFPEFHRLYFSMATALEPRFGGSAIELEAFAREMAKLTESFEGFGMYGRIYWNSDHAGGAFFDPHKSLAKWTDLKKAHLDLSKKYPKSDHNRGYFASLACRAGDDALYKQLKQEFLVRPSDIYIAWPGIVECDKHFNTQSTAK